MFKKILLFKQSGSYFKLSDLDFEEELILVWCVDEQMAVLIHEKKKPLRKRIIKKISKKKKSLIRKLRNIFIKNNEEEIHTDDMDFCCQG